MSRPGSDQKNGEDRHRSSGGGGGAMSSHPSDANTAHAANGEKPEKDLKAQHDEPVEQHRSSRRPKSRQHHSR